MSTTTTTTSTTAPKTTTLVGMLPGAISTAAAAAPGFEDHCASCGEKGFMSQGHYHSPEDTQRRIKELESQVQFFQVQTSGAGEIFLFLFFYSCVKTNRNSRQTGRVRRGNPPSAIPNKRRLHPPNLSILRSI